MNLLSNANQLRIADPLRNANLFHNVDLLRNVDPLRNTKYVPDNGDILGNILLSAFCFSFSQFFDTIFCIGNVCLEVTFPES